MKEQRFEELERKKPRTINEWETNLDENNMIRVLHMN